MKYSLLLLLCACASSQNSSRYLGNLTEMVFENPESSYYHADSDTVYVSNVAGKPTEKNGKGFIGRFSKDLTKQEPKWVTGLNAPKGMRIHKGILWVSDVNQVVKISVKTGEVLKKITIAGAKCLNDIAINKNGIVYVSDTFNSSIYRINKDKYRTFLKGQNLESPNGLLIKDEMLYVASWGLTKDWSTKTPGRLYAINLKNKKITYITSEPLGNLDGLEFDKDGNFLVSDWVSGKVFRVTRTGDSQLVYTGKQGIADIGYIPSENLTLLPSMVENQFFALKL